MQKPVSPSTSPGPAESGLFDLILICLRHLPLLVLLPLAVGAAVYALAHYLPKTYSSNAIIQVPPNNIVKMTPPQVAAMLTSVVVLDPVIDRFNLAANVSRDRARTQLADRVRPGVGRELLVKVEVLGNTPEDAKRTAEAVLESWLRSTVPSEREKADLKRRLEVANTNFQYVQQAVQQLTLGNPAAAARRENGISAAAIGELGDRYLDQMLNLPRDMEGMGREVIRQPPTLPTEPVKPRKSLLAIAAALATATLVLVWLAIRHLLEVAQRIPARAERLRRLRAALPFGRKEKDAAHA